MATIATYLEFGALEHSIARKGMQKYFHTKGRASKGEGNDVQENKEENGIRVKSTTKRRVKKDERMEFHKQCLFLNNVSSAFY